MLTPREIQIIDLAAEGKSYQLIAKRLSISFNTVHAHLKSVRAKLHAKNTSHAIVIIASQRTVAS